MTDQSKSIEANLIHQIKRIKVTKPETKKVMIHNPTNLPVIFQEKKRAVIGIDATRCAAYFEEEEDAEQEFQALLIGMRRGITPKVYGRRGTYVVMELITAPTVADWLEKHSLTKDLSQQLLHLLQVFKEIGYTRLDHDPGYIHLMPDGSLKVVNVRRHTKLPPKLFPKRLITGMGKQVTTFLQHVKKINPALYRMWSSHPEFQPAVQKAKLGNRK